MKRYLLNTLGFATCCGVAITILGLCGVFNSKLDLFLGGVLYFGVLVLTKGWKRVWQDIEEDVERAKERWPARLVQRVISHRYTGFETLILVWLGVLALGAITVMAMAPSENVQVKYDGLVDLSKFECHTNPYPSFVKRLCFQGQYMKILLQEKSGKTTWYPYCGVDAVTKSEILTTEHMGTYYARNIRGHFDCRLKEAARRAEEAAPKLTYTCWSNGQWQDFSEPDGHEVCLVKGDPK